MGRWLDATGKLPRPWMDSYSDMGAMVELWDIALAEAIKAKGLPVTILYDEEGKEIWRVSGTLDWASAEVRKAITG